MTALLPHLAEILGVGQALLWQGFLVFLRVGAAMALLPAFGEQTVPLRVRLVLTLAFTAVVAPAVDPPPPAGTAAAIGAEVTAGLVLGLGLRLFILALQTAGTIAAQSMSLSQLFAVASEPMPAVSHLLAFAGLALAVSLGLHVRAAELLILSYAVMPPGRLPVAADLAAWGLDRTAHATALAFSLAAPFVIAGLLYNLALGVINRAMPQLMVAFVGAPALSLGALALLSVAAVPMMMAWQAALDRHLDAPFAGPP